MIAGVAGGIIGALAILAVIVIGNEILLFCERHYG